MIALGATPSPGGTDFAVRAPRASAVWLCLFEGDAEGRVPMTRDGEVWRARVDRLGEGTRYGYRADGDPPHDAAKLLVDPYATALDRAFGYDPRLGERGVDTAALVPKAVVSAIPQPVIPGSTRNPASSSPAGRGSGTPDQVPDDRNGFKPGGLIYELNVRGFTMRHPDVPEAQRGTIAALAHPAIVAHLTRLGVDAVELMPIVAWIDERHLPPLGLANAWGYNPVVPMALDPRLAPGGVPELVDTVAALHAAGIGVILDLVFNHSGESDLAGPTLSFRGLDDAAYARAPDGTLINDTGTGNTFDFANPAVRALALETMRHFARAGVDGFRFDLATIMARGPGFDAAAPIFAEIAADPLLATRVMIAEPWDPGPGGYHLGDFPPHWLEWNDRYRDDVRRFWRGDAALGAFATRLAGSSDIFGDQRTRSVNFLAAHDGFTLRDLVSHEHRHNHANGEDNRDGHEGEIAWNNGVEGATDDPVILARRDADVRAMLATLFASRGTIMLAAGDEFGRTQRGNNNAYAQDNDVTWLDWAGRDTALEAYVADLSARRRSLPALSAPTLRHDTAWHQPGGAPLTDGDWATAEAVEMRVGNARVVIDRPARRVEIVDSASLAP